MEWVAAGEVSQLDDSFEIYGAHRKVFFNPPWKRVLEVEGQLDGSLENFWKVALDMPNLSRLCVITDMNMETPKTLTDLGWQIALAQRMRVSGRLVGFVLVGHPQKPTPTVPEPFNTWRNGFIEKQIITA